LINLTDQRGLEEGIVRKKRKGNCLEARLRGNRQPEHRHSHYGLGGLDYRLVFQQLTAEWGFLLGRIHINALFVKRDYMPHPFLTAVFLPIPSRPKGFAF